MEKIKIGLFGCRRGDDYLKIMLDEKESIEVLALCDKDIDNLEAKKMAPEAKCFTDYDEFLAWGKENGMNAVILTNFFHKHAEAAIKAMKAGMNVVSECTAAVTLKECVELVECVEETGKKYMLAENYPFFLNNMKMAEIIKSGALGSLLYATGEYNHSGTAKSVLDSDQDKNHWRAYLPRTYYNTHALGPVMYMTSSMPKYVSARAAHSDYLYQWRDYRHNYDGTAMMWCEMDNGMMAMVTGCTAMASDYHRYGVFGDVASLEWGHFEDNAIRVVYQDFLKPSEELPNEFFIKVKPEDLGEKAVKAENAGHGGADYFIIQNMIDYFANGIKPFFDVYKAVAMSAVAILGWRSCLEHGKNYRIPDFRSLLERDTVRHDDLTPFVDENGEGNTLPAAAPFNINNRPTTVQERESRSDSFEVPAAVK